jgi:prevent-host-death family protein
MALELVNLTNLVLGAMLKHRAMAKTVNLYEAKTHLSALVDRAADGEEIVIAKAGKPRARLVPIPSARKLRQPGGGKGKVWIAEDFDAPLPPDLLAAFSGH